MIRGLAVAVVLVASSCLASLVAPPANPNSYEVPILPADGSYTINTCDFEELPAGKAWPLQCYGDEQLGVFPNIFRRTNQQEVAVEKAREELKERGVVAPTYAECGPTGWVKFQPRAPGTLSVSMCDENGECTAECNGNEWDVDFDPVMSLYVREDRCYQQRLNVVGANPGGNIFSGPQLPTTPPVEIDPTTLSGGKTAGPDIDNVLDARSCMVSDDVCGLCPDMELQVERGFTYYFRISQHREGTCGYVTVRSKFTPHGDNCENAMQMDTLQWKMFDQAPYSPSGNWVKHRQQCVDTTVPVGQWAAILGDNYPLFASYSKQDFGDLSNGEVDVRQNEEVAEEDNKSFNGWSSKPLKERLINNNPNSVAAEYEGMLSEDTWFRFTAPIDSKARFAAFGFIENPNTPSPTKSNRMIQVWEADEGCPNPDVELEYIDVTPVTPGKPLTFQPVQASQSVVKRSDCWFGEGMLEFDAPAGQEYIVRIGALTQKQPGIQDLISEAGVTYMSVDFQPIGDDCACPIEISDNEEVCFESSRQFSMSGDGAPIPTDFLSCTPTNRLGAVTSEDLATTAEWKKRMTAAFPADAVDVWFSWSPEEEGTYTIGTCGAGSDGVCETLVAVYERDCESTTQTCPSPADFSDGACFYTELNGLYCGTGSAVTIPNANPNNNYFIQVFISADSDWSTCLSVEKITPKVGDTCQDAEPITVTNAGHDFTFSLGPEGYNAEYHWDVVANPMNCQQDIAPGKVISILNAVGTAHTIPDNISFTNVLNRTHNEYNSRTLTNTPGIDGPDAWFKYQPIRPGFATFDVESFGWPSTWMVWHSSTAQCPAPHISTSFGPSTVCAVPDTWTEKVRHVWVDVNETWFIRVASENGDCGDGEVVIMGPPTVDEGYFTTDGSDFGIVEDFEFPCEEITVEMWVKKCKPEEPAPSKFPWLDGRSNEERNVPTDGCTPFSYCPGETCNTMQVSVVDTCPLTVQIGGRTQKADICLDTCLWEHIAFTWSIYTGEVHLYNNGQHVSEGQMMYHKQLEPNGNVVIGQRQKSKGGDFLAESSFDGMVDEVKVWSVLRTPKEIVWDMNAPAGEHEGLAGAWYFDGDADSDTVEDVSGGGATLTIGRIGA